MSRPAREQEGAAPPRPVLPAPALPLPPSAWAIQGHRWGRPDHPPGRPLLLSLRNRSPGPTLLLPLPRMVGNGGGVTAPRVKLPGDQARHTGTG